MDDLEFLDEILDDDITSENTNLDYLDEILEQNEYEDLESDECEVLDDEFIETHLIPVNASTIQNFPFIEDDVDAITDYELFSKGFGYLEDKKADKEELSEYVKKDEIPPLDDFVTKDTQDLEYYTKTSDLSSVALTGSYDDLSDKPTIPDVSNFITKDVNDLTYYTKSSDLASVATSGDYDDLLNKPTIPDVSNFITKDVNDLTYYTKSSDLATVATTGDYDDLLDKPTIPDVSNFITKDVNDLTYYTLTSNLASVATTGSYTDLSNTPSLATVATTGSYNDLTNKPTIPTVPTNISAFNNDSGYITKSVNDLTNYTLSSSLSSVATSGSYTDLSNKPTIPTKTSDLNNDSGFITKSVNDLTYYTKTSSLSTVATTGDYDDLLDKPTLFSGSYTDLTDKPTIPTVYNGSLTLKRNGNVVQIFTANNQANLEADFSVPDIATTSISSVLENSWGANGACITGKIGNVKFIQCCVRNGITDTVTSNFPANYRPSEDLVLPAQSYTAVGYAILRTNGTLTVSSNFVNNSSNVLIGGIYL